MAGAASVAWFSAPNFDAAWKARRSLIARDQAKARRWVPEQTPQDPRPAPSRRRRKRRHLLTILFHTAISTLQDAFRTRLGLPDGQLAAIAAVQIPRLRDDYLVFHPHAHVLAATGLYDREGRFHEFPVETFEPLSELFRHRFIATLLREKLISEKMSRQLLNWTHSGFSLDAGGRPVRSVAGRQQLAEYLTLITMEPIRVPALFRWAQEDDSESIDASHLPWHAPELPLDDERILVLDGDPGPADEFCGS